MNNYEDHPIASIFPLIDKTGLAELAEDIRQHGLNDDLTLYEDKILDGRNRYRACALAKVTPTFTEFIGDSPTAFVLSKNLFRRQLTESQRAAVAVDSLPFLEAEAKKRQKEHGDTAPGRKKTLEASLPQVKGRAPQARDRAAKLTGVSARLVQDAKAVKAQSPEKFEAIKRGELTANKAMRELKKAATVTRLEKLASTQPDTLTGHFDVMVIDPPWPVQKIERDCRPNQVAALDYPVMTLDEIRELPLVRDHAADDCHVFLWTTHKHLPAAFELFQQWEVDYCCTFVWHKPGGFQPVGLPQFNCEFCLYGRVGSPIFIDTKKFNVCFSADRTKHSAKPEDFYAVLRRVTAGRRLDAFNRRKIEGFTAWGNEAHPTL